MTGLKNFFLLASIIGCGLLSSDHSKAADIEISNSNLCKVKIRGPILKGDLKVFKELANAVFDDFGSESTASHMVCLDSPGGSFVEGIKIARYFYETGVGTVIDDGAICLSSCATIFMMGKAEGDEVSFINRKLHIRGTLGFHRPKLSIPTDTSAKVDISEVLAVYNIAADTLSDFVQLANSTSPWSTKPMVKADLIERMFATTGEGMFFIDTVEKAYRWDIDIFGMVDEGFSHASKAYYACENVLQLENNLFEENLNYVRENLQNWGKNLVTSITPNGKTTEYAIFSNKAGYVSAGCVLVVNDDGAMFCGHDENSGVQIGVCSLRDDGDVSPYDLYTFRPLPNFIGWPPKEKLTNLATEFRDKPTLLTCKVYSSTGTLLDEEQCSSEVQVNAGNDGTVESVYHFTWPSGNKTALTVNDDRVWINGNPAESDPGIRGICFRNLSSRNSFCYSL